MTGNLSSNQVSNRAILALLYIGICMGQRGKNVDFSEAVVAYNINADLCSQLNEFYKYQMSRSFTCLGPRSLCFSSFKIFSKTADLIETKLNIEHQWGWEIKVCF